MPHQWVFLPIGKLPGTVSGSTELFTLSCSKGIRKEKLSEMVSAHVAKWEKLRFIFFLSFCSCKVNTNFQRYQHQPLMLYSLFHESYEITFCSFHSIASHQVIRITLKKPVFLFLHSCETLCCHCEGIIMPMPTRPVAEYTVNLVPNYKHAKDSLRNKAGSPRSPITAWI